MLMFYCYLLLLWLFTSPVSCFLVDAGAQDEDTSVIIGENWNHVGGERLNILETDTPEFFRSHRSGPNFTYNLDGFVPGKSYNIELGFAEVWGTNCFEGARVMRIFINDEVVKDQLDVFKETGCFSALLESFNVTADSSGAFKIRFEAIQENSMVSFINIVTSMTDESSDVAGSTGEDWTDMHEDQNYVARHECSFVQSGNKFYMLGGRESPRRLDIYDYAEDSWTTGADLPEDFNHFQAVNYQNLIWVIGAFQTNRYPTEKAAEFVYVYDPANDIWIQGPQIPVQRRRGGAGLVVNNGKFYVVGGNTVGHSGWCLPYTDEFDPALGSSGWTSLPDAPTPRDHFQAAVLGDRMYAASGRCTSRYSLFGDTIPSVDVFDFQRRTWLTSPASVPADLPSPRAGAAVAVLDGKILVMGGESSEQTDAYDTVNSLDPTERTWSTLKPLNHARHGTQAISSGNGIVIAGGSPARGHGSQRNMEWYQENAPVGVPNVAGVLSIPSTVIEVFKGFPSNVLVQHVSGNQGVIVQEVELSGESANEFVLTFTGDVPLLVGEGSSLEIDIEYTGNENAAKAQIDLIFSGNVSMSANVVGMVKDDIAVSTTNQPPFLRSRAPSEAPSQPPSGVPSSRPTVSTPPSVTSSPPPTNKPRLRPSQSPPTPPATTREPLTEFADIVINAGASDEDMTKVSTATTWTYKVFPFVQISNTDTPSYYRSHRSAFSLTYTIDSLEPETLYSVSLGFAEIYRDTCGVEKRVMDIIINNKRVQSDLDVFAEVGCEAALIKSYEVPASASGRLEITISASKENAMLSYLSVTSSVAPSDQDVPTSMPTDLPPSMAPSDSPSVQPTPSVSLSSALVIDAGSQTEDAGLISGNTWTYGIPNSISIAETDTPAIFRTHRSGPKFSYILKNLTPGTKYDLTLGFSEIYRTNCQPGARIMDISVNEILVKEKFDVFLESGCEVAHLEEFSVIASSEGQLTITIEALVENAMLSLLSLEEPSASKTTHLEFNAGTQTEDTALLEGDTWTYGVPSTIDIADTDFDSYFRTHRSGTTFVYTLKDLHPHAKYDLILGFAEIWRANCSVGKRVMIISINGKVVKDNLDVFLEAGCESAHTEVFSTEAKEDGTIEVTFDSAVENAMISYISLAKASTLPMTPSQRPSLRPSSQPSLRPSSQPSLSPTPTEILVDAGAADEDVSGVSPVNSTWTFVAPVYTVIQGTSIPSMFRTHRSAPTFFYTFEGLVPSGDYHCELGFAETWYKNCDIGKRLMSIGINNNVVNPELDVYKEVGCNTAYSETYTVKATNSGEVRITFNNIVENAMVSLIRLKKI